MKLRLFGVILLLFSVPVFTQIDTDHASTAKAAEIHLTATVQAVVPLTEFSGHVIPADFNPRFALTVLIGTVTPAVDELVPGSAVTFAIHSPALLFEGDPDKQSVYDFYLTRETEDGKVRFTWLNTHGGSCSENEMVGYPLNGWAGLTNTGEPVAEMTITAHTTPNGRTVATAKTDSAGRFSFPSLGPGKYYLKGMRKIVGAIITADDVVTVRKGQASIVCLVAEAEERKGNQPQ